LRVGEHCGKLKGNLPLRRRGTAAPSNGNITRPLGGGPRETFLKKGSGLKSTPTCPKFASEAALIFAVGGKRKKPASKLNTITRKGDG